MAEQFLGAFLAGLVGVVLFFIQFYVERQENEKKALKEASEHAQQVRLAIEQEAHYQLGVINNFVKGYANLDPAIKDDKERYYSYMIGIITKFPKFYNRVYEQHIAELIAILTPAEFVRVQGYYYSIQHINNLRDEVRSLGIYIGQIHESVFDVALLNLQSGFDDFFNGLNVVLDHGNPLKKSTGLASSNQDSQALPTTKTEPQNEAPFVE